MDPDWDRNQGRKSVEKKKLPWFDLIGAAGKKGWSPEPRHEAGHKDDLIAVLADDGGDARIVFLANDATKQAVRFDGVSVSTPDKENSAITDQNARHTDRIDDKNVSDPSGR